jgi:hypothetical protein
MYFDFAAPLLQPNSHSLSENGCARHAEQVVAVVWVRQRFLAKNVKFLSTPPLAFSDKADE